MENKKLNNNLEETRFDEILNKYKPLGQRILDWMNEKSRFQAMKRKPANLIYSKGTGI